MSHCAPVARKAICLEFTPEAAVCDILVACHSKLDYCNSLYHNLPKFQITRLQQIQNSLARALVKDPKSSHITAIFWSLHWLCWWRGTVVERRSLAGELSLSCARPAADG